MAENDQDNGLAAGTTSAPTPDSSQAQVSSSSGIDVAKLQQTLDSLVKRQDEIDARTRSLQGDKDKGVNKLRHEVQEIQRIVAGVDKLRSSGLELDQAAEEFDFRETVRGLREQLQSLKAPAQPAGNGGIGAVEAARLVAKYELDATDALTAAAINAGGDVEGNLAKLAFNKSRQPSPTAAQAPAVQGAPPPPKDDSVEAKTQQYIKDMKAAQGKPDLARAIREKAIKDGVPVGTVVFT